MPVASSGFRIEVFVPKLAEGFPPAKEPMLVEGSAHIG